jgi:hypothetical protein
MCAAFLVGGGILLTYSLAQVQIRVVYSDLAPLDNLTNAQRSLIMQGRGVYYIFITCAECLLILCTNQFVQHVAWHGL